MQNPPRFSYNYFRRRHALEQSLQQELEIYHYPRIIMVSLISFTGLLTFVLSFGLRVAGVTNLAVRYLIVWVLGYLIFILLLRLWAYWKLSRENGSSDFDVSEFIPENSKNTSTSSNQSSNHDSYEGEGGQFGGGGAKGSWDTGSSGSSKSVPSSHSHSSSSSHSYFDSLADIGEAEALPFIIILAILAFIVSLFGSLAWMTYSLVETAPILLAELLADILIINGLGRRLRIAPLDSPHWFFTIWKRTQKFFWCVVGCIVVLFCILHFSNIHVQTLGELVRLL